MFVFLENFIQCILNIFTPLYPRCPHLPTYPTSYSVWSPVPSVPLSPLCVNWAQLSLRPALWMVSAPSVVPLKKTGSPSPPPAQSHASSSLANMGLCAHLPCSELGFCLAWAYVVLACYHSLCVHMSPAPLCLESTVFLTSSTASGSYNLLVPFPHRSLNLEERGLSKHSGIPYPVQMNQLGVCGHHHRLQREVSLTRTELKSGLDSVRLQAVPGHRRD